MLLPEESLYIRQLKQLLSQAMPHISDAALLTISPSMTQLVAYEAPSYILSVQFCVGHAY